MSLSLNPCTTCSPSYSHLSCPPFWESKFYSQMLTQKFVEIVDVQFCRGALHIYKGSTDLYRQLGTQSHVFSERVACSIWTFHKTHGMIGSDRCDYVNNLSACKPKSNSPVKIIVFIENYLYAIQFNSIRFTINISKITWQKLKRLTLA